MISKFENVTSKSFEDYTSTDELAEVNLFFGINGSGKSAIADWIYTFDEEATYTFDTQFIDDNLRVNDNIDGVRLVLGEEVIEREEQINDITEANQYIERNNVKFIERNQEYKELLYNIIDRILQDTKREFNFTRVNHKPNTRENPILAIDRWRKDSEIDIEVSDDISGETIERELKELPIKIQNLNVLFSWLTDEYKGNILNLFTTEVEQLDDNLNGKLLNWLSVGLEVHDMHEETEMCEFCNQKFNVTEVKEKILKQIDTDYKNTLDQLGTFKNNLESSLRKTKELQSIFAEEAIVQFQEQINKILDTIERKKQNTERIFDLTTSIDSLLSIDKQILDKKNEYTEILDGYQMLNNRIEQVIRKKVGEYLSGNSEVEEIIKKIERNNNSIKANEKAIRENMQQIEIWSDESSDLEPFMRLVNYHLIKLGVDFYLEISADDEGYILLHRDEAANLQLRDLSEGELRLLGFLYFYHSAFSEINEDEVKVLSNIKYIVIDDPITSLDTNNRYYVTNMLNNFVGQLVGNKLQNNKQVFIMTHSSIDFHNICYGFNAQRLKKWNIFKDEDGKSQIKLVSSTEQKNYSDYYKSVMLELMNFAKISRRKLSGKRNFLSYGNKGRFILESHARTHYNIENTTTNNYPNIKKCYEIPDEHDNKSKLMLDIFNSLSHGVSISDDFLQKISPIEVQKAVLTLIKLLYEKDPYHIDAIGEGVEDYSQFKKNKITT